MSRLDLDLVDDDKEVTDHELNWMRRLSAPLSFGIGKEFHINGTTLRRRTQHSSRLKQYTEQDSSNYLTTITNASSQISWSLMK